MAYNLSSDKVSIMVDDYIYNRKGITKSAITSDIYTVNENDDYVDQYGNVHVNTLKNFNPENYINKDTKYYSGNPVDKVNSSDNTGVHWLIQSSNGYKEAKGFVTLPTLSNVNSVDRPNMYFGVYGNTGNVIGDYGLVYVPNTGWYLFRNASVWKNGAYTAPAGETNKWSQTFLGDYSSGKELYLQVTVNNSTSDSITVTVRDASTWLF